MILPQFARKKSTRHIGTMANDCKEKYSATIYTASVIIVSMMALSTLSACQHHPQQHIPTTSNFALGQANCLKKSSYSHPQVSGKIIDTPNYMLVTIMNHNSATTQGKGELCIVDKRHGNIDITAVDHLRFLQGVQ